MATTLVYHTPGATGQVSPFDIAVTRIVQGKQVDIACPYLTVRHLRRFIALAVDWRLLTDVGAWVASLNEGERAEIIPFLTEFNARIRHDPRLHAKVIVTPNEALVGSANLTQPGMFGNIEMSVSITDANLVRDLRDWFNTCWELAKPISPDSVRNRIASCPLPNPTGNLVPMSAGSFPAIAATPVPRPEKQPEPAPAPKPVVAPSPTPRFPDIRWITAVFGSPESKGANRTHIAVHEKGRLSLLKMVGDLLETKGQVALYIPLTTEDAYAPGLKRGKVVAVVELLPMPDGKGIEDYFYRDIVDNTLRWPYGWPCRTVYAPPVEECPSLKEHVESLFGSGSFQPYTKRFVSVGPFELEPKMRERLNADFAQFTPLQ